MDQVMHLAFGGGWTRYHAAPNLRLSSSSIAENGAYKDLCCPVSSMSSNARVTPKYVDKLTAVEISMSIWGSRMQHRQSWNLKSIENLSTLQCIECLSSCKLLASWQLCWKQRNAAQSIPMYDNKIPCISCRDSCQQSSKTPLKSVLPVVGNKTCLSWGLVRLQTLQKLRNQMWLLRRRSAPVTSSRVSTHLLDAFKVSAIRLCWICLAVGVGYDGDIKHIHK